MNKKVSRVPAGGPATIKGVVYQLLWSLLRVTRARIHQPKLEGEQLNQVTIILEPQGGGGDLVVHEPQARIVEQLKARADGGTWSLQEIVESVIPDLYLALRDDNIATAYRFVTEGRIGDWIKPYEFFQSLLERKCCEKDALADLDDTNPITFGRKASHSPSTKKKPAFWDEEKYTERTLFNKLVAEVRKRASVSNSESESATQQRLRKLMGNFEFIGGREQAAIISEIDAYLLSIVDRLDEISKIRDSLCMELARRATNGSAEIDCELFFSSQGLNAVSLREWGTLLGNARKHTKALLSSYHYEPERDVRVEASRKSLEEWSPQAPVCVISGESGCGKSWRAFAMCASGQAERSLHVIVPVADSFDLTMLRAANAVWQDIAGHDESIPLTRIAHRVRTVIGTAATPWLTLYLEGAVDYQQTKELTRQYWEEWGIRIVVPSNPNMAARLEAELQNRCHTVTVEDFNIRELHQYLGTLIGDSWVSMPEFVRNPLRKPLLARIYRRMVEENPSVHWHPRNEYELFDRFWMQLQTSAPVDEGILIALTRKFRLKGVYPWNSSDLLEACRGDNEAAGRLERSGWLRIRHTNSGNEFEFTHARLLNWAYARELFAALQRNEIEVLFVGELLYELLFGTSQRLGEHLGFVPMDLIWMMCRDAQMRLHLPMLLNCLDKDFRSQEVLFQELLPTLGAEILDSLTALLQEHVENSYKARMIAQSIGRIGGSLAQHIGCTLLSDPNPLLQRLSLEILQLCPTGDALDNLWKFHRDCQNAPTSYFWEHERNGSKFIYSDTFAALRECCRQYSTWLDTAIVKSDPSSEPVSDLAYLLANLPMEARTRMWEKHKAILLEKVPANKQRSLVTCIFRCNDLQAVPWLVQKIPQTDDLLGPMALRALVHLTPTEALANLPRLPVNEFPMLHHWFSDQLFALLPQETRETLRNMMRTTEIPWHAACFYERHPHQMDVDTLELLVNDLEKRLDLALVAERGKMEQYLWHEIRLVALANTKTQLDSLRRLRGTLFEQKLVQVMEKIGARGSLHTDSLVRQELLTVLHKVNGNGFSTAVHLLLNANSRFGRLDGIRLASRAITTPITVRLEGITQQEETWDGAPLEQCEAAAILAANSCWAPVLSLVQKLGNGVFTVVTDYRRCGCNVPEELLDPIEKELRHNPSNATPGMVQALSWGTIKYADTIKLIAARAELPSDVAHACTIALEMMEDHDPRTVPFLYAQLAHHKFSATNALIVNGTQEALDALAEFVGGNLEGAVALNLIERTQDTERFISLAKAKIIRGLMKDSSRFGGYTNELYYQLIKRLRNPEHALRLLDAPQIEEALRIQAFADEGNGWNVASKASAIRCLAYLDPDAAFQAAKAALHNFKSHDRDYYPPILAKLNPQNAATVLMEVLANEDTEIVRRSIGMTLAELNPEEKLLAALNAESASVRRAACYVAGWLFHSEQVVTRVRECLRDEDDEVVKEAAAAIKRITVSHEVTELCQALLETKSASDKWLYLDCLLELADPGDIHRLWPIERISIGEVLTPLQHRSIADRLKKRREEINKDRKK